MSMGGFEYGGFDPMGGFGNNYNMDMGGGGFMGGGEMEVKSSEKKRPGDRQSLIPVTIKQLQTAERQNDTYIVDGRELNTVQIVGTFTDLVEHSTNIVFKINDGTDVLEGRQWIEKDTLKHNKITSLRPGSMVRVVGQIRDYEGNRHILAFEVFPLEDFNQLTHHLLDVMLTHLRHTQGPVPGSAAPKMANNFSAASPMGRMGSGIGMPAVGGGASLNNSFKSEAQGITEIVYKVYTGRGSDNQEGLHISAAMNALRTQNVSLQPHELMSHVRQLCDDGRLYSTVDDEHHKPTSEDF